MLFAMLSRNEMGIAARLCEDKTLLYLIATKEYDKAEFMMKRGARPTERIPFGIYNDPHLHALMLPIHLAVKNRAPTYIIELLLDAYPESIFDREATGKTPIEMCNVGCEIIKSVLEARYNLIASHFYDNLY